MKLFDIQNKDIAYFVDIFNNFQKINVNGSSHFVIGYLMTQVTHEFISQLIAALGFRHLNETIDVYYNLLWYLNVAAGRYAIGLNNDEKEYISGLDSQELLDLLGPRYNGPHDKASLLFALVSGQSSISADITNTQRYYEVLTYPPIVVWYFARKYNIIRKLYNEYSLYPPYVYLALHDHSIIENITLAVNIINIDILMDQYGIVLQPWVIFINKNDEIKYFIRQIIHYDYVFTRPPTTLPPPLLINKSKEEVINLLKIYTLKELTDAYEPVGIWIDHDHLIDVIFNEGHGGSVWSWLKGS